MVVVKLKKEGLSRVLNGEVGMTFIVNRFSDTVDNRGRMAHVRDYRCPRPDVGKPFQTWSIGPEGYEVVEDSDAPV